ncbi:microprocessor complex subunit DGCR8 [Ctenocephalides felis]|uniref:microprocessor complex subunit DGCR8 n=1 Tax=Ctenocephalides felis TaxID=7515 RepID=UPI000E6E4639|nr:microprocessor complex subunit DGCR8 [Ctenocephalides felis]XP_026468758.1 microprocessor complex subunit DGCR8 [Ctenocephalides felis]
MACEYASKKIKLELEEQDESNTSYKENNSTEEQNQNEHSNRHFHILDEATYDMSDSDQDKDYSGSEVGDDEIEAMLEAGLPDNLRGKLGDDSRYEDSSKTVLEELFQNHFEVLPEGWIQVTHNSGMPIYLHRASRVCCMSRPYFLGPGSSRKHEIPLSAIPCLSYRKALEKLNTDIKPEVNPTFHQNGNSVNGYSSNQNSNGVEDFTSNSNSNPENNAVNASLSLPCAKIETAQENLASQSLSPEQLREYCSNLFKFKVIKVMRFKSWSARRKFTRSRKNIKQLQRPTLPDGTKLITCPVVTTDTDNSSQSNHRNKKEFIMNPNGKSYVCILHEYVQHALKKQPSYEFKELENAATPYSATVSINDMLYGVGYGTSKKQAKSDAARATLEILIPEMREKIAADNRASGNANRSQDQDLSFFDEIKIEDPRVAEFCAKTTEPSPHTILLTCLQRNYGLGNMHINYEVNTVKHQKNEFTMTVGKHVAKVICKNKRDGKQRASQAILQALHPHISSWGSLLRLYGSRSVKSFKEKKQEEQEITLLQSKAAINQPNYAILEKLRVEMEKLEDIQQAIQPIGTFIAPEDVNLPSTSSSNLNIVEL